MANETEKYDNMEPADGLTVKYVRTSTGTMIIKPMDIHLYNMGPSTWIVKKILSPDRGTENGILDLKRIRYGSCM